MAPRPSLSLLRPLSRLPRATLGATRSLATVQSPPVVQPVKRAQYGGLRDQDRIFSNAYRTGDHGIKGAMVSCWSALGTREGGGAREVVGWFCELGIGIPSSPGVGARCGLGGAEVMVLQYGSWRERATRGSGVART
jgi:hypothetical protein